MVVHSLNCCLPETEGDVRPWQYTVWTVVCWGGGNSLSNSQGHYLGGEMMMKYQFH